MVSDKFFQTLSPVPRIAKYVNLHAANEGQTFMARVSEPIEIKVAGVALYRALHVAPIKDQMLLGFDILKELRAVIDLGNDIIKVSGETLDMRQVSQSPDTSDGVGLSLRQVSTCSDILWCLPFQVRVPPGQEVVLELPLPSVGEYSHVHFEPSPKLPLMVPHSVLSNSPFVTVSFLNVTDLNVRLKKGTKLGFLKPIESVKETTIRRVADASDTMPDELPEELEKLWQDAVNSSSMSDLESERLKNMLIQYRDVFATDKFDIGNFTAIEHHIDTGDASPVSLGMRRTPIHFIDHEKDYIDKMLTAGVIRPSCSSWAAAPVLVKKKDGEVRWCLDYRKLNACTKKDVFPVPVMSECLDALVGNLFFSKLDAANAY